MQQPALIADKFSFWIGRLFQTLKKVLYSTGGTAITYSKLPGQSNLGGIINLYSGAFQNSSSAAKNNRPFGRFNILYFQNRTEAWMSSIASCASGQSRHHHPRKH